MTTTTTDAPGGVLPAPGSAHWMIRASAAATFIYHGATKFPALSAGAEMMGFPLWFWTLIALVETGAGVFLLAGGAMGSRLGDVVTRLGGLGIAAIMIGAIALVHWGQWSNIPSETHPFGGMEFQTLLLAVGLFFAARGNAA